jgi:hypothetical protein
LTGIAFLLTAIRFFRGLFARLIANNLIPDRVFFDPKNDILSASCIDSAAVMLIIWAGNH